MFSKYNLMRSSVRKGLYASCKNIMFVKYKRNSRVFSVPDFGKDFFIGVMGGPNNSYNV